MFLKISQNSQENTCARVLFFLKKVAVFRSQYVLKYHTELLKSWEWSLANVKDTKMEGCIIKVKFVMKNFDVCVGCCLGKVVLRQIDNLSKSL